MVQVLKISSANRSLGFSTAGGGETNAVSRDGKGSATSADFKTGSRTAGISTGTPSSITISSSAASTSTED